MAASLEVLLHLGTDCLFSGSVLLFPFNIPIDPRWYQKEALSESTVNGQVSLFFFGLNGLSYLRFL